MAAAIDALNAAFPSSSADGAKNSPFVEWQDGQKGHKIHDIGFDLPADHLFECLFGQWAPVAERVRQHHGTKDYRETDWVSTEEEAVKALHFAVHTVPSSSGHNPTSGLKPAGNSYAGRVRMNLSSSSHFGKQTFSFERERCLAAALGGPYTLEICVYSTAVMGDKFRCLFTHRITAVGSHRSRWGVEFEIVFVEKTNFLLRKSIEAGAHSTVKRNFDVMATHVREYIIPQKVAVEK